MSDENSMNEIETAVNENLDMQENNSAKFMQLATDATRVLSIANENFETVKNTGFFDRILNLLPRRKNQQVQVVTRTVATVPEVTKEEFEQMKLYSQKALEALNERNLLTADALITVKNNLNTLDVKQQEIKEAVVQMAQKVAARFEKLENKVYDLEESQNLNTWIDGIEVDDSYEVLPETIRFLKIVKDYYYRKQAHYSRDELKLLRKAIRNAGLDYKKQVSLGDITDSLLTELQTFDENEYLRITQVEIQNKSLLTGKDLSHILAVPSFVTVLELTESKKILEPTVKLLQKAGGLALDYTDALKMVIKNDIAQKNNIDMNVKMPLSDLGIELISCYSAIPTLVEEDTKNPSYEPTPRVMFCSECGTKLETDATFCPECGHKVS